MSDARPRLACEIAADRVLAGRVSDSGRILEAHAARMDREVGEDKLLAQPGLRSILFSWAAAADGKIVRDWTTKTMGMDAGAIRLAQVVTAFAVGGPMGSYAQIEIPRVDRKALAEILDVDALARRLEDGRGKSPADDAIIDLFFKGLSARD